MSGGHNKAFLADPRDYLSKIVVMLVGSRMSGHDNAWWNQPHAAVYMELVLLDSGMKSGRKVVRADFSANPAGDATIEGAWVPYVAEGTVNQTPAMLPAVELPVANPKFVFTGAMNGCSLVMATKGVKSYAIHYPNSGGATKAFPHLTGNGYTYVKSIDYFEMGQLNQGSYGTKVGVDRGKAAAAQGNDTGWFNTFAFFYLDQSWKIIAQPQFAWQEGLSFTAKITKGLLEV